MGKRLGVAAVFAGVGIALGLGWMAARETALTLSPDLEVERRLTGGDEDVYRARLEAGHALSLVVSQLGVDVAVTVFDPRGRSLLRVDGPNGPGGPESLAVVAGRPGEYRLAVRAAADSAGSYRLRVEALGPAGDRERMQAQGMALYQRAERRRHERKATSLKAAVGDYRRALDCFRVSGEALLEARTQWRLGLSLVAMGDAGPSLPHFEQALELYRHQGNDWERGPLYNSAGDAFRQAGDPLRARQLFVRAIEVSRPLGNAQAVTAGYNNLGLLHASLGEMQLAFGSYDRALKAARQLGDSAEKAKVLHNLGVHYVALGRRQDGLDYLDRARQALRRAGDLAGEATTLTAIGWAQALGEDFETALATHDEALRLRQEVGDRQGESVTLDQLGTVYLRTGRYERALDFYRRALRSAAGNDLNEAYTLIDLAEAHLAMGRPGPAVDASRRALQIFRGLGVLTGQSEALVVLARAQRRHGRLTAARGHLEAALEIVESVRGCLQSRWLRRSYLAAEHDVYGAYVDLLMWLEAEEPGRGHAERAFEASERARARALLESLAASRAGARSQASPEILERERRLRAKINAEENRRMRLIAAGSKIQAAALEGELRRLLSQYEAAQGELGDASAFAVRSLSLAEIREEVLDDDSLLLAYALGEERSFLWVVGRHTFGSHVLPPRSEVEELASQLRKLLPRSHLRGRRGQTQITVRDLSRAILGPVADELHEQRLLILADGALQYVPFAALPSPRARAAGAGEPSELLLAEHEIVYLPSASVLALLRRQLAGRRPAPGLVAVLADPVFGPDDPRLERSPPAAGAGTAAAREGGREWSTRFFGLEVERLPHASDEADAILALTAGGESLRAIGLEASRELVLSGELDRYRIVHFATHGFLNAVHPALSGIVLSLVDETGRPRDGMLRMHEIFDLSLSAELVVLSGCRTALGENVRGEGLVGLPHAFFNAGAPRLVASFWNVNDAATAELMTRFYQRMLRDRMPPARALRAAQRSMARESRWQAPYYWAGFAIHGEWRATPLFPPNP